MVNWLQSLLGLSYEEARYVATLVQIVAGLFTVLGTGTAIATFYLGKWLGMRDHDRRVNRNFLMMEGLVTTPLAEGRAEFSVAREQGVHSLDEIFGEPRLVRAARGAVARDPVGTFLFPEGSMRHRAYEIISANISGGDPGANQAALFGRHNENHRDLTAFMVINAIPGTDRRMPRVIKASPAFLMQIFQNPGLLDTMLPFRGSHIPYVGIARWMAAEFVKSERLFEKVRAKRGKVSNEELRELEREAGGKAGVWLAMIRTHKVGASAEEVREIVRQEVRDSVHREFEAFWGKDRA